MKKTINTLKSIALIALISIVTIACDKDFANIDSDIQGIKNFDATSRTFPVIAYTQSVTPFTATGEEDIVGVQTTSLTNNFLGVYKDPNPQFGTTSASIITQVIPTVFNPDFGTTPIVESVKLTIPYFSTLQSTNADGEGVYTLDSIYGDSNIGYKLSIYESKYLLRDLDPSTNFEELQLYYSNQEDLFCDQIGQLIYVSGANNPFRPSTSEVLVYDDAGEITERLSPRLQLELFNLSDPTDPVNTFWQNLFFSSQGKAAFDNTNSFVDYFRGLIFKVEALNADGGSMILLNFGSSDSNIVVDYTNEDEPTESDTTEFTLNFNGRRANTFNTTGVTTDLNEDESIDGDANLYLKGLDGYMAIIDLFGDEENEFINKKDKWLINEANLIFYVDENMVTEDEPSRLLLFDLKNNTPIIDFFLDGSTNPINPNESKTGHAEALSNGRYKFRLTNHVNNILLRDSTNVKLGLYVISNVNLSQNSKIQNTVTNNEDETVLSLIPTGSILQPKGTVLHGNQSSTLNKRPEFEIFYTEPEN